MGKIGTNVKTVSTFVYNRSIKGKVLSDGIGLLGAIGKLLSYRPRYGGYLPSSAATKQKEDEQTQVSDRPFHTYLPLIALVGLPLAYLGLHLVTPFTNGRLEPGTQAITARGVMVTPLDSDPVGLQAGDVVTGVNGRSLESWLRQPGSLGQVGETVSLTVLHATEETVVDVTLARYPLGVIVRQEWGALVFRMVYLLVALYVYARRPGVAAARILLLTAAAQFSAVPWLLGAQIGDFVTGVGVWLYFLGITAGFMLSWIAAPIMLSRNSSRRFVSLFSTLINCPVCLSSKKPMSRRCISW